MKLKRIDILQTHIKAYKFKTVQNIKPVANNYSVQENHLLR